MILMADDPRSSRSGMRRLLSDSPTCAYRRRGGQRQEALDCLRRRSFGVVLLDVNMSGRSGLDTLRRIGSNGRPRRSSCCQCARKPSTRRSPCSSGAGCSRRTATPAAARRHPHRRRRRYCRRGWPGRAPAGRRRQAAPGWKRLTEREWHVLQLIVKGVSLTGIGERTPPQRETVSTYRGRVLAKLGLHSNAELVRYCLEHGWRSRAARYQKYPTRRMEISGRNRSPAGIRSRLKNDNRETPACRPIPPGRPRPTPIRCSSSSCCAPPGHRRRAEIVYRDRRRHTYRQFFERRPAGQRACRARRQAGQHGGGDGLGQPPRSLLCRADDGRRAADRECAPVAGADPVHPQPTPGPTCCSSTAEFVPLLAIIKDQLGR